MAAASASHALLYYFTIFCGDKPYTVASALSSLFINMTLLVYESNADGVLAAVLLVNSHFDLQPFFFP